MKLFNPDNFGDLPMNLKPISQFKEYSVQLRDPDNASSWWGVTLPNPSAWFRWLRILKPAPMKVVFMQDSRLKFEHIILVPIRVEGHEETQSYKIPQRSKGDS